MLVGEVEASESEVYTRSGCRSEAVVFGMMLVVKNIRILVLVLFRKLRRTFESEKSFSVP